MSDRPPAAPMSSPKRPGACDRARGSEVLPPDIHREQTIDLNWGAGALAPAKQPTRARTPPRQETACRASDSLSSHWPPPAPCGHPPRPTAAAGPGLSRPALRSGRRCRRWLSRRAHPGAAAPRLGAPASFSTMRTSRVVVLDTSSGRIVAKPLEKVLTLDLIGSVGLFDFAELAVHLPVPVYDGDDVAIGGQAYAAPPASAILRLMPKSRPARRRLLRPRRRAVRLPTGDDAVLRPPGDITVEPKPPLSWWEWLARARRQPRLPALHHRRGPAGRPRRQRADLRRLAPLPAAGCQRQRGAYRRAGSAA